MIRAGGITLAMLLSAALGASGLLRPLDMKLLDAQFRFLHSISSPQSDNPVVLVGFDETTAKSLREPFTLWHDHLGKLLQAVAGGGAAVFGLDVVLPDRSFEDIVPGLDRKLITGLVLARRNTPLVLAMTVDPSGHTRPIHPPLVTAAGPDATGYALLHIDSDGKVRRFDERIEIDGLTAPTLVGQMARRMGRSVNSGLLDYSIGGTFTFVPMQQVLAWWDAGDLGALSQAFAGKAVLFGSVMKYEDRHPTPVNLVGWDPQASDLPGIVVHGQTLRNILGRGLIHPAAPWTSALLASAALLLWLWIPRPAVALGGLLGLSSIAIFISTSALHQGRELPVVAGLLVAFLVVGARQLHQNARNLRERRRLRLAFGGYVSPPVLEEILSGKLRPILGGEKCFACVLFSDIRGYTPRSEHMSPEDSISFLNGYFQRVVPIIHAHGGTVVGFMGDGIMAVFGAPKRLPNACQSAYAAAIAMLADRCELNRELESTGEPPLQIGIGLHAGYGVAGHIGAESRHEYSVIGDVTNVASRLEGVTKEVGYRLVCSKAVADQLAPDSELVELGHQSLKGHSPVEIYGREKIDGHRPTTHISSGADLGSSCS